jgi:hypothetical protein
MAIASTKQVKSSNLFKACLLGLFTTAGLGLIVLPAYADAVSVSRSGNSASATGKGNSVRQSIQQSNSARSDGKGDVISIQDARNNATASGENNHVEQDILQSSEQQQVGSNEEQISRQNAESNAVTSGKNNRIQHRIEQSTLQQHFKR